MPNHRSDLDLSNPFCAARLRPGTIDFVFEQGKTLQQLVDTLEINGWHGQITGGHGTGKSTLLAALAPAIEARGRLVKSITLVAGQRHLPREFIASLRLSAGLGVAAVDGVEQLHPWNRLLLRRICQAHAVGLVVASHRRAYLLSLYETVVDEARAWRVVERLQHGFPPRVEIADLVERLARHQGNLREALFDLYDLYEERSRG
ncbi:MAG: hypothetical protein ACLP9L_34125 [Thermoguttaceae bacterium]